MYQIDDVTAVTPVPAPPTDSIGTPGFFTGGSPGAAIPATRVRFWWLNCVQQALVGLLIGAGIAQSKTDFTVIPQAVSIIGRRTAIFAANGTFTVPAGVYRLRLRMWAAGGSGGGCINLAYPGGGGGGGGYTEKYIAVTPGQVIPVTVRMGTAASPGGASSFGTFATATGGGGGGIGGNGIVGLAGSGGLASGGDLHLPGAPGSNGFNFGSTTVEGGRGGPSFGGGHTFAAGGTSAGFNANSGTFPGGGSSGCTNATAPGGNGLCIVEF